MPRTTSLHSNHLAAEARMGAFGNWEMPLWYPEGISAEVAAVRERAGVFDVSHMGEFLVSGPGCLPWLQGLLTNDLAKVAVGAAQYTLLLDEGGGVVDDLIAYRLAPERWRLVVNAGNVAADLSWLRERQCGEVALADESDDWALLAVQGPEAVATLERTGAEVGEIGRFGLGAVRVAGAKALAARTGYTGEDGFEIFVRPDDAPDVWDALVGAGAQPCGLGARDVLRLEVGYPLHGQEMDRTISPLEAGLGWVEKMEKGAFVGREALEAQKRAGVPRRRLGLFPGSVVRAGDAVFAEGDEVGVVTSGSYSPTLSRPIALALVVAGTGEGIEVLKGGRRRPCQRAPLPFYRRKE
ncbi:glycine cleavage system aminomethyltransferase GcvT [bacterium]|nr:glycine cleavage system aminomethyltransferase GcvT [bacterium]